MPISGYAPTGVQIEQIEEKIKRRLGEREDLVEKREKNVEKYIEIANLCIAALTDNSPSLAKHLSDELKRVSE